MKRGFLLILIFCVISFADDFLPKKQSYEFEDYINTEVLDTTKIPEPVFDARPDLVQFYWLAWRIAWDHVKKQENVPQSPYMDEAHWKDTIWIWDTCFMVHFCKYAPDIFPGIESLDNFYQIIHTAKPTSLFVQHPDNPPLFAWTEYEYYKMTGNKKRIKAVLLENRVLQQHFDFFENAVPGIKYPYAGDVIHIKREQYGYRWHGNPNGMDNTPRGNDDHGAIYWLDAAAQQGLAALYIGRLAKALGNNSIAEEYNSRYTDLKQLLNTYYWSEKEGIYYDISIADPTQKIPVKTPASYWPMLAEMTTSKQAEDLHKLAEDEQVFGGKIPWPSVLPQNENFESTGMYWRGGVWLPTAYMAIKALEKYGYLETARESAQNLLDHMYNTYENFEPQTIWESYSPTEPKPATKKNSKDLVRKDFCGWSALGPISLFIENILGFHEINAPDRQIEWYLTHDFRHGIERLKFGEITTHILYDNGRIIVQSNSPYTLNVNGETFAVKTGENEFLYKQ